MQPRHVPTAPAPSARGGVHVEQVVMLGRGSVPPPAPAPAVKPTPAPPARPLPRVEITSDGEGADMATLLARPLSEEIPVTPAHGSPAMYDRATQIFGGSALKDFSFMILIGLVIGTYSSVFIASPVVLWWSQRKGGSLRKEILHTTLAESDIQATP